MQLQINERQFHYDDFGEGPPVVLIHGFPLSRRMWAPQTGPLTDAGYRVILPDLRGFGASEGGGEAVRMDDFADDLVHLFDHLGIDRAFVGGMSMGGYVLLNLLDRHPERVAKAMFIVTRAAADDEAARKKRDELIAAVRMGRPAVVPDAFADVLFADATPVENPQLVADVRRWMENVSSLGLIGGLAAMRERADYVDRLGMFRLPALVIGADQDRAIPLEHYTTLVAGLPNAEGTVIAEAGHMANLEKPAAFNRALLRFLEKNGKAFLATDKI